MEEIINLSSREVKDCLNFLIKEFRLGNHNQILCARIQEAGKNYPNAYKKYYDFFNDIEGALLENSYFHLIRILDWSKITSSIEKPISFRLFLRGALDNLEIFKNEDPRFVRKKIKSDLQWASPVNNIDIKNIIELRHTALAHIGRERLAAEKTIENILKYESRSPSLIRKLYNQLKDRRKKKWDRQDQIKWRKQETRKEKTLSKLEKTL